MAFFSHHHLQQPHPAAPPPPQQQQQQPAPLSFRNALPVPVDGQIPAPLAFFNAPPAFPDQAGQPQLVDAAGLTAAAGMGWRQPREQELLGENSQMSSIDFLQTGSAVSTGLALSLEDRRHGGGGAGAGNSSGDSPLLLLPMLDDDISREVQRLDADMDRFIRAQALLVLIIDKRENDLSDHADPCIHWPSKHLIDLDYSLQELWMIQHEIPLTSSVILSCWRPSFTFSITCPERN